MAGIILRIIQALLMLSSHDTLLMFTECLTSQKLHRAILLHQERKRAKRGFDHYNICALAEAYANGMIAYVVLRQRI